MATTQLTFEDAPVGALQDYGGLNWNNFFVLDTQQDAAGYAKGEQSGTHVAFIEVGVPELPEPLPGYIGAKAAFSLHSLYLSAAWYNGVTAQFEGSLGGKTVYTKTLTVDATAPTLIQLDFVNVDTVKIVSSGGRSAVPGGGGSYLVFDDLTVTLPE